ncbi:PAS domain-containing sensor histidine kinase [Haloferax volcanii]|uniref:Signal-transducing histidine kinase-like protein n=3 Tax=Haloferax volcanii TaxID=2246 RepID=L9VJN1_HALVD|nr:PAS domain-containing sensor histidine kinase [Haloferax volcanii]ELY37405.1 signal-transducing histidine kinase-like protein [Haloferax volcanii DS2]MBS8120476.1 PAS domain-containing sensor histidine kinase [Haloferax volcanii]MBS8125513.1 PAS domain-containing sensor histidine kinase [Haloferax volcanii]MBS8129380.1 PAS domain-containing sensor histidine kinase [Haloferax volcanii]MBS8133245.1 PAS domain-containing sensor histidine kinase [Haloferax volcanii]
MMNDSPLDGLDARAIALAYLGFGTAGILGGELLLSATLGAPPAPEAELVKGLAFVAVSTAFVWALVSRKNRRIERQQASVRSSLDQLRTVVAASPVPIIAVTPEGRVTRWNDAATETFGWGREEVLGGPLPYDAGADSEDSEEIIRRTIAENGLSDVQVERQPADGDLREFRLSTAVVRDADGEVAEIVGVFVDVTEQQRRERRLREFEQAVEQAGHAIYLTTPDGEITYVNPAFEETTGYDAAEVIGEPASILSSGEMPETYYERLWRALQSGETWQERIIDRRKSGELYTAIQTIAPIESNGDIDGYVAIQSDVTESEVTRQRLGVLNRMFRHNLRNRMNVIEGYAELIRQNEATDTDEELAEAAEAIVEAADDLASLSEKAQTVSDALESEGTPRRVSALVEDAVSRAESTYPEAAVRTDIETGLYARVDSRVGAALDELIANALKHGGETVRIDVRRTEADDSKLVVRVDDDGPGIPDEEWRVIKRGEETPLEHGTGMGLWLVHWVVKKAGGSMELEPSSLGGTAVTLKLPIGSERPRTWFSTDE